MKVNESQTKVVGSSSVPITSTSSSLPIQPRTASSLDTSRTRSYSCCNNRLINWISSLINRFLIAIGIRSKPIPSNVRSEPLSTPFNHEEQQFVNFMLTTAITDANKVETGEHFPTLKEAKFAIEQGADVGTLIKVDETHQESVLDIIIDWSNYTEWNALLPLAIQKASQVQIRTSLERTIKSLLNGEEKHLIEAARLLIAASNTSCKNIEVKKPGLILPCLVIPEESKTLESWDKEKNWGLFPT